MNDRFKTRVWDKTEKVMHYNDYIITATGYLEKIQECSNDNSIMYFNQEDLNFEKDKVCMFSTDLKDKNGKLIFERDILKFRSGNKFRIGKLEVYKCEWLVSNSNFCQGAWCGGALINLYNTCEVIGNIYENAELLEE